ncbi:hypothetical protein KA005_35035 [bacterium]|nr:hypothetical protein [bacterium]
MSNRKRGKINTLNILFRVDADESLGLGHLARCGSLMVGFESVAECRFVIATNRKDVVSKFLGNIRVTLCGRRFEFAGKTFDIVITDVPEVTLEDQRRLRQLCRVFVCIDDKGCDYFLPDVIIRPSIEEFPKHSSGFRNTQ